jgi:hypothetical protein
MICLQSLAFSPPPTIALAVARVAAALDEDAAGALTAEARGRVHASADCREGMAACAAKRAAVREG